MKKNVFGYSAVVGVEVAVVPLILAVVPSRPVAPVVVASHRNHVLTFFNIWSKVESASHHAVLAEAKRLSVEVEVGTLPHAFKLHKHLIRLHIRHVEVFPIPHHGVGEIYDVLPVCLVAVEGVRQCYRFPTSVVILVCLCILNVADLHQPSGVEIEFLSFYSHGCHDGDGEYCQCENSFLHCCRY